MKTFFKLCVLGVLLYFGYQQYYKNITLNYNDKLVSSFLSTSNYHLSQENYLLTEMTNFVVDMNNPELILYKPSNVKQAFYYHKNVFLHNVYIYNTHPTEAYKEDFDVIDASMLLQEKLENIGIHTIVEKRSASTYIKEHDLPYEDSYLATREFLKDALKEDNYDLIIDLHRDVVPKGVIPYVSINDNNYAKIMFVMNKNYDDNMSLAMAFDSFLAQHYPGVSRGIYDKYRDDFNQDLSPNNLLIELGMSSNTKEEIINSIDALVEAIKVILDER